MNTERETKTVTTKSGQVVVYKSWISGGENNALQAVWLKDTKLSMGADGKTNIEGFGGLLEQEAQKKLIELLVVSVNDKKENIVGLVEDFPLEDYQEVISALNFVTGKKK